MIPKHVLDLVEAIRATGKKLQTKDAVALKGFEERAKNNRLLTYAQSEYLQSIYAEVTGGGQYESRQYVR